MLTAEFMAGQTSHVGKEGVYMRPGVGHVKGRSNVVQISLYALHFVHCHINLWLKLPPLIGMPEKTVENPLKRVVGQKDAGKVELAWSDGWQK